MENKTALQQAFSDLEEMHPHLFNTFSQQGRDFVYHFHKYLEIEKQQINKVAGDWFNEAESYMHDGKKKWDDFEDYYNQTFNK
jgi:hypothetical protein